MSQSPSCSIFQPTFGIARRNRQEIIKPRGKYREKDMYDYQYFPTSWSWTFFSHCYFLRSLHNSINITSLLAAGCPREEVQLSFPFSKSYWTDLSLAAAYQRYFWQTGRGWLTRKKISSNFRVPHLYEHPCRVLFLF